MMIYGHTLLDAAIENCHLNVFRILLRHPHLDVNICGVQPPPLYFAISKLTQARDGEIFREFVTELINDDRTDVDQEHTFNSHTALHCACSTPDTRILPIVEALLAKSAHPNKKSGKILMRPLHVASKL